MKTQIVALATAAMIGLSALAPVQAAAEGREHLYVSISSPDINQVGMMMEMASAALATERASTVVLGADGFRNALRDGPQDLFRGRDKTPRELLEDFMDLGGEVLVCGLCLKMYGVSGEDLIEGVEIVSGKIVVNALFGGDNVRTLGF